MIIIITIAIKKTSSSIYKIFHLAKLSLFNCRLKFQLKLRLKRYAFQKKTNKNNTIIKIKALGKYISMWHE